MKINRILSFFTPKDIRFFPLLTEMATVLDQASSSLIQLFSIQEDDDDDESSRREKICKKIKEQEIKGDLITNQIFKELNETFITPFDREDISILTDEIDNALDAINRSAHKVSMYTPIQFPNSMMQLSKIIKKGTNEVFLAIQALSNLKINGNLIRTSYKAIKCMEGDADVVYEKGIVDLFHSNKSTFEIMKSKEIIQELEKSTNKMDNIGKALKNILIKYT